MNELFEIPESKSPRLLWMDEHNVKTRHTPNADEPWEAWRGNNHDAAYRHQSGATDNLIGPFFAVGSSEHDAICTLSVANGWKLWNEDQPK